MVWQILTDNYMQNDKLDCFLIYARIMKHFSNGLLSANVCIIQTFWDKQTAMSSKHHTNHPPLNTCPNTSTRTKRQKRAKFQLCMSVNGVLLPNMRSSRWHAEMAGTRSASMPPVVNTRCVSVFPVTLCKLAMFAFEKVEHMSIAYLLDSCVIDEWISKELTRFVNLYAKIKWATGATWRRKDLFVKP